MLRLATVLTFAAASSLFAQSRDTTDILKATRAKVGKSDTTITRVQDVIELRADTAWVTVWVRQGRFGHEGEKVRVERRAGEWVTVRSDVTTIVSVRY